MTLIQTKQKLRDRAGMTTVGGLSTYAAIPKTIDINKDFIDKLIKDPNFITNSDFKLKEPFFNNNTLSNDLLLSKNNIDIFLNNTKNKLYGDKIINPEQDKTLIENLINSYDYNKEPFNNKDNKPYDLADQIVPKLEQKNINTTINTKVSANNTEVSTKQDLGIIESIKTTTNDIINGKGTQLGNGTKSKIENFNNSDRNIAVDGIDLGLMSGTAMRTFLGVAATTFGSGLLVRNYLKEFGVKSSLGKNVGTIGAMAGTALFASTAIIPYLLARTAGLFTIKGTKWIYKNKKELFGKSV